MTYLLCAKHGPEADSTPPLPQGRRQVVKGGGLDPRYDKRGGGGGGGGGGGAVRFRPDTKSGCVCVCVCVCVLYTSGTIRKAGGLLSRRGGGTLHERDLLNSARFTIDY